eukprot:m.58216 g.58216  ORF g.58216 m.58216 type:complete len:94 (-) comp11161_c1_seq2:4326-4607(-)
MRSGGFSDCTVTTPTTSPTTTLTSTHSSTPTTTATSSITTSQTTTPLHGQFTCDSPAPGIAFLRAPTQSLCEQQVAFQISNIYYGLMGFYSGH